MTKVVNGDQSAPPLVEIGAELVTLRGLIECCDLAMATQGEHLARPMCTVLDAALRSLDKIGAWVDRAQDGG